MSYMDLADHGCMLTSAKFVLGVVGLSLGDR
jgi:hypothetical protein